MRTGDRLEGDFKRETQQAAEDRVTASLAGLALTLALVVLCLFLTERLRDKARLDECLLSGRADCAVLIR